MTCACWRRKFWDLRAQKVDFIEKRALASCAAAFRSDNSGSPSQHQLPLHGFNRYASRSSTCTCKAYSRELCTSIVAPPLDAPQLAMLPIKSVRKIIRCAYRVLPLLCIAAHRCRLYYGHAGATTRLQHAVHLACCKLGHGHMLHSQAASLLHGPASWPPEPWISFMCQLRRPLGSRSRN